MEEESVYWIINDLALSLLERSGVPAGSVQLGAEAAKRFWAEMERLSPVEGRLQESWHKAPWCQLSTTGGVVHLMPAPEHLGPLIVQVYSSHRNGAPTRAVVGTYLPTSPSNESRSG